MKRSAIRDLSMAMAVILLSSGFSAVPNQGANASSAFPTAILQQLTNSFSDRFILEFEVPTGVLTSVALPLVAPVTHTYNLDVYDASGNSLSVNSWTDYQSPDFQTRLALEPRFTSLTNRIIVAVRMNQPYALGRVCDPAVPFWSDNLPTWWGKWADQLVAVHEFPDSSNLTGLCQAFRGTSALEFVAEDAPPSITTLERTFFQSDFNGPITWNLPNLASALRMFYQATEFNSQVRLTTSAALDNLESMFFEATSMNSSIFISDTSGVSSFAGMFYGATAFNQPLSFDVSGAGPEGLGWIFEGATAFNSPLSFSNTSLVTDFQYMFAGATAFNQELDFDFSGAFDMSGMFEGAASFNSDVSNWDLSNVQATDSMFKDATAFNQDLSSWSMSNVITLESMFENATSFNRSINAWSLSGAYYLDSMFARAQSFNKPISLNLPSAISIEYMFESATAMNSPVQLTTSPNLVRLSGLFLDAVSFNSELDISDTTSVEYFEDFFAGATSFNQPVRFDTDSAISFQGMFSGATSFDNSVSLSPTASLIRISRMFSGATAFNQHLDFDTSNVQYMNQVFAGATSYNQPLTISTSNVSNFSSMFEGATSFNQSVNLDFSSAVYAGSMFKDATSFNQPLVMSAASLYNFNFILAGARRFNSTLELGLYGVVLDASSALTGSGLSCEKYEDFLNYMVSNNLSAGTPTDLGGGFYPASAIAARNTLAGMGWILTDAPCPAAPNVQQQLISNTVGNPISYSPPTVASPTWFEINPALPLGLSFNNLTGEIAGQVAEPLATTHQLRIFNPAGSASATISIIIEALPVPALPDSYAAPVPKLPVFELGRVPVMQGEKVKLLGKNFDTVLSAFIAGRAVSLSSISEQSFIITIPDIDPGLYDMVLDTHNGRVSYRDFFEVREELVGSESLAATLISGLNPRSSWIPPEQTIGAAAIGSRFESVICIAYNHKPGLVARKKALSRALHACGYAAQQGAMTRVFVYGKAPHLANTVKILSR